MSGEGEETGVDRMARRLHEIDVEHGIECAPWDRLSTGETDTYLEDAAKLIDAYENATY